MTDVPPPPTRRKILLTAGSVLLTAAAVIFGAVLPAEYAVDPLGTGRLFGLLALGQAQPVSPAEGEYRVDRAELSLDPAEWVEYFYRLEEGSTMLFTWNASGPVEYDFHASPDGAPAGYAESFDARALEDGHGAYTAPFTGIHGWYWENTGTEEITITLHTAGFYTNAHEGRDRAAGYRDLTDLRGNRGADRALTVAGACGEGEPARSGSPRLRTMRPMKRWLDWRRWMVYVHRWLGIAGGVLFVAWFLSGVVMMYARMPGMANEERLARAPALDLAGVTLTPIEAARAAGLAPAGRAPAGPTRAADGSTAPGPAGARVDRVRIGMRGDRAVYRFGGRRNETIVFADTGEALTRVGRAEAEALVHAYAPGYDGPFHYDGYLTEPDQWTLQARGQMPMHRFALDDADGTQLYVSSLTGDVVLRTTRSERFWGYLGPVIHWIYFTPLRKHGSVWLEVIIWTSLLGCVMCLTGLVWGLWRYAPVRRFRLRSRNVPVPSPYVGLMKWHHYTGLFFGVITVTWAYSGLLSVGPFDWFQSPGVSREQRRGVHGRAAPTRPAGARRPAGVRGRDREGVRGGPARSRSSRLSRSGASRTGSATARPRTRRRRSGCRSG